MAGLGSAWGSREEFLHPRDRHGRFRKKWQMAQNVIDAISNFLDGFNPRTFQSDGQSSQYLFNRAKPSRFGGGSAYPRLHADYDEANANLRTGNMDESTKKFVKMMDDSAINLDSDLILSRTVGPDAFGLTPEQLGLEDGGIEDFTGRLIADRGYSAANIGTPMSHGPGKITMSIAVPKGTKAIIPARSPNDRGIFLDRDQELRITKVKPDGAGGYYMMAVATPRTPGNTPEPINRGPRGVGLTPQEREARVTGTQHLQAKREGIVSDAKINAGAIEQGTQQVKTEQPAQLPPAQGAPSAPGGPPPRNEPIHAESIGGADTQGKGTAEIAQTKAPETPAAPQAPALPPEAPPAHVPDIRSAVREANIPSPSAGDRRREWNNAFLGVASGKKNPEDMLRELESDIQKNRHLQEDDKTTGRVDPHLADDIKAQDQLADVIAKEFGLQRQTQPSPVKKAAPSKVTPIAQAPGEKHRGIPGEAGTRPVTNLEARRAAKAVQAPRAPQREEPTPPPAKKATPEVAKVIPIKKAGPNAPTPEAAAAPNIDKMTKAELLAHARRPEISANIRTSMTKDQIKQEIRRAQEVGPPEPGSRVGKANQFKEAGLGGTVKELQIIADHEGVPRRGRPTNKAKLQEAILANRAERANAPAVEPNAPAAQKVIQAPDRREAFAEDWINTPAMAKITEHTAAGRTINEVRDDVLKGKITPDEGIRRLENDIDLNKQDLTEVEQQLRGDHDLGDRLRLQADREKLRKAISDQELASSFMRKHFRNAPAVTPKEIEVQLDPEAKKLIDNAGPDDIREAAKLGGFGELKGETKDELLKDLIKKTAARELESRADKKAAPKKLAPAPLVTKKSSDPDYVDARAIAEGLGMDEGDQNMLKLVQDMLDGTGQFGEKPKTPAAVGRELVKITEGPAGPHYEAAVKHGVTVSSWQDRLANADSPGSLYTRAEAEKGLRDAEADVARLNAKGKRWKALADRLQKTRRRPARKATEPAPEKPKLTTEEKKVTAQAAEVLGVPKEQLQAQALRKRVAAAPPPEAAKSVVEQLGKMESREEGTKFLERRTKSELQDILRASGAPVSSRDNKADLVQKIVQTNIGARLEFKVLTQGTSFEERRGLSGNVEDMTPAQLADMESSLGIKRASLDRGDRIAAIKAAQAEKSAQASIPKSLPSSGKRWDWATIKEDGGVMHGDSASMNLAQKLHKAGREDAAQYVADMRYHISNSHSEHDAADVEKMVSDLKKMRDAEQDTDLKRAYDRALEDIDAPQSPAPKIPASTPEPLKKMMSELNQIPVARRTGHFAGTTKEVSAVDRLAQLIQKVEAGDAGSIGAVESEIDRILRSFHESVDGAYQMWRLGSLIDNIDIRKWIRSHYPKT